MHVLIQTAVMVSLLLSAGCGFHLRGVDLPEHVGAIYVQAPSALANELVLHLESGGASIASTREDADTILIVDSEDFDRRVLSVRAGSGKVGEYELVYTAVFRAVRNDGLVLLNRQSVNMLRDYVFDADAVIGKSREQGVLRSEMRRDAAQQIVRRLQTALRKERAEGSVAAEAVLLGTVAYHHRLSLAFH